jgi:hypothetical protein
MQAAQQVEDFLYQSMTVAAMIIALLGLWLF